MVVVQLLKMIPTLEFTLHKKNRNKQVYIETFFLIRFLYFSHCSYLEDLIGRKKALEGYLQEIHSYSKATEDPHVLDRVLSLMMQAAAALKAVCIPSACDQEVELDPLPVKEKFAPAQKHEIQLRLWKTAKTPGRKRVNEPMRLLLMNLAKDH